MWILFIKGFIFSLGRSCVTDTKFDVENLKSDVKTITSDNDNRWNKYLQNLKYLK